MTPNDTQKQSEQLSFGKNVEISNQVNMQYNPSMSSNVRRNSILAQETKDFSVGNAAEVALSQPSMSTGSSKTIQRRSCCQPSGPTPVMATQGQTINQLPQQQNPYLQSNGGDYNSQFSSFMNLSTFQNPLNPTELAFIQANAHLFNNPIMQQQSIDTSTPHPPPIEAVTGHTCCCGDGCDCLGCASHPYNTRTVKFVRSIKDMMVGEQTPSTTDSNSSPSLHKETQTPNISQSGHQASKVSSCCGGGGSDEYSGSLEQQSSLQAISPQFPLPLGQSQMAPRRVSTYSRSGASAPTAVQTAPLITVPNNNNMMSLDFDSTHYNMSADAFFHVEYPIGLCGEEADGCLCGEGCACVGCLTHGGHDGISVEQFSNSMNMNNLPLQPMIGQSTHQVDLGLDQSLLNSAMIAASLAEEQKPVIVNDGVLQQAQGWDAHFGIGNGKISGGSPRTSKR
jgi:hypothetical protein